MVDEIVEAARFFNRVEAEVACAKLRSEEISAFLKTDDAGGLHPELDFSRGIGLMVLAADKDIALKLLTVRPTD